MVDITIESPQARQDWSRRRDTARMRDLIIAVSALAALLSFFTSMDLTDWLFEWTRTYEAWELDEILLSIPVLTLVMAWYSFRRWQEASRLNRELAKANETLETTHARALAAEAQMRDAQRLEALGRLAGGLAHELNNMLQPAITLTQLSLKNDALADATRTNLEKILEASECSRDIVSKALTFAGSEPLQKERVVFSSRLRDAVDFSRTAVPATVEVVVDIPDLSQSALINRTELTQIVTNLMTNAARAMDGKGTLTIALGLSALPSDDPGVEGCAPGDYFKLQVCDTGHGMTEEVQRRLFDPFFTTAEGTDSVGLGLAVVHGIVNDWNGRIMARSKPGAGTCFTIFIPVAAG